MRQNIREFLDFVFDYSDTVNEIKNDLGKNEEYDKHKTISNYVKSNNFLSNFYLVTSEIYAKEENINLSINLAKEALLYINENELPYEFSKVKMNLAIAYDSLSEIKDKEKNLKKAVKLTKDSLKIFNKNGFLTEVLKTRIYLNEIYNSLLEIKNIDRNLFYVKNVN